MSLDTSRKLPMLEKLLEDTFVQILPLWTKLGIAMANDPGADAARAPTATAYGSDFGICLAWEKIAETLMTRTERCLIVCDDPWLFRHLAGLSGINAGHPPILWPQKAYHFIRGTLARLKVALRVAVLSLTAHPVRIRISSNDSVLLVYSHPQSRADSYDAYFGDLMTKMPRLKRLLHGDSTGNDLNRLLDDKRTAAIHAWGNIADAVRLLFVRWSPKMEGEKERFRWLILRAAAIENGGGGPAMIRWQSYCQERWLKHVKPACVCWPWENHSWERNLCRSAKKYGVKTLGYQHTAVGPHQINYSTATNPDGLSSIPDMVICNGPAYRDEIAAWGVPAERLIIGGALRFKKFQKNCYDPSGPIFIPLSADSQVSQRQIRAAEKLAASKNRVLIKEHPMYPANFRETQYMSRTKQMLTEQKGLSAVVFCTGTSGLEAVLMGVPTYRLILDDKIAIDILPLDVKVPAVTLGDIESQIKLNVAAPSAEWDQIFSEPDMKIWNFLLFDDKHANITST